MDICASRLQSVTDADDGIVHALDEISDLVKSEGGWTVYRLGKIGLIDGVIILGNYIK